MKLIVSVKCFCIVYITRLFRIVINCLSFQAATRLNNLEYKQTSIGVSCPKLYTIYLYIKTQVSLHPIKPSIVKLRHRLKLLEASVLRCVIDRQRANSCMCCCPKLTFILRSKSWLRTPTLAMDIAFGLTVSPTDSINKRILTKQITIVKILIVTVCNHFQCV